MRLAYSIGLVLVLGFAIPAQGSNDFEQRLSEAKPSDVVEIPAGEHQSSLRVDLWKSLAKPARFRSLGLVSTGDETAFDQIVLGRAEADLPQNK